MTKEEKKEYSRKYNAKYTPLHREHKQKYDVEYRKKNKEKYKEYSKKWSLEHPERTKEIQKEWRVKNPERFKEMILKGILKRIYGLTVEEYNQMFVDQNGVCAICKKSPVNNRRLCVDHNHETGKIRGLLCDNCNLMLGNADDNINTLTNAIDYLDGK